MLLFFTAFIFVVIIPQFTIGDSFIISMLYAYIMQQYITKKDDDN
jgi:hypothetical protein